MHPRGLLSAVASGSAALARRLSRKEVIAKAVRLARSAGIATVPGVCCALALGAGGWLVLHRYMWAIGGALAAGWVVLALMHSRPTPARAEAEPATEEAPAEAVPSDPHAAFLQHLRQAIGDRPGIHLRELVTRPPLERCTIADIRALCESHRIPIRASQKVGGDVSVGIRLTDLQALSPEEPQETRRAG
ncbi:hypothetical protein GCM10010193_70320 [Kitasatospora atroaurantiaca]